MDILLIVATLAVAAAGLYVAATFNRRTRQHTAPLVDGAAKEISGHVDETAEELRRQLKAIATELQRDRDQIRLDGRKIQGRLDHADTRITSIANQLLAELEAVRRLGEQLGARQDQLGADLRQLDHTVTQLSGPPARPVPATGHPVADAPPDEPAALPDEPAAVIPGRLYAERLRFATVRVQPEPFSGSGPQFRIEVERLAVEFHGPHPGAPEDPSAIIRRAHDDQGFRERLSGVAADYLATKLGDPAFAVATERWVTQTAFPETALVEAGHRIGDGLEVIAGKPLEMTGTELRLPGLVTAAVAGVGADLILQPVTEPLGQVITFLEITGVAVGLATGLHPLALASMKMLAHDEFHDLLARGIQDVARRLFEGPEGPAEGPEPAHPAPGTSFPETSRAPFPAQRTRPEPSPPPPDPADSDWFDPGIAGPGSGLL
jgi:hypothetical protein